MPKNIAYFRVSTQDQDLDKNKADILHFANDKDLGKVEFVEEKISGTVSEEVAAPTGIAESFQEKEEGLGRKRRRTGAPESGRFLDRTRSG